MKTIFIPGLGEQASKYKDLPVVPIDWNNIKLPKTKANIVAGFSFGAILACEYAIKTKVDLLVLCSMTPGVETLKKVRAKQIIFLVGDQETWLIKDAKRLKETAKNSRIRIVPNTGHRVSSTYKKILKDLIN